MKIDKTAQRTILKKQTPKHIQAQSNKPKDTAYKAGVLPHTTQKSIRIDPPSSKRCLK